MTDGWEPVGRDAIIEGGGTWRRIEELDINHTRRFLSQVVTAREAVALTFTKRACIVHAPRDNIARVEKLITETTKCSMSSTSPMS